MLNLLFNFHVFSVFQQHGMSQYPSFYVKPVYRKEDQEELAKTGEIQKLTHVPTRAALNDQTCSLAHDSTVKYCLPRICLFLYSLFITCSLFINYVMREGKKTLARELVEKAFENIKRIQLERYHKASPENKNSFELNPKQIFHNAVSNCKPVLALTPIKRGGVKYQVTNVIASYSVFLELIF